MFQLKVNKNIDNTYSLCQTHLRFKSKVKLSRFKWSSNEKKLLNNVSRAKTNCFNIVYNNKFTYFFTQTISSTFCRNDLKLLIDKFRYYNKMLKRKFNQDFFYLIIPEYHQDKQNWHLHGFLSSNYKLDSYINKNGFLSLHTFDNIGWNSISEIRNYTACCKYILKYITKETALILNKGEHFYYCSKNLKRDNVILNLSLFEIAPIHFDFKNEFCFKTNVDEKKYYNFITKLDRINRLHYYYN